MAADRHGNHAGGDVVARIHSGYRTHPLSREHIEHVRDLAFASLAQEAAYLARHAEDAWAGERVCGEHVATAQLAHALQAAAAVAAR